MAKAAISKANGSKATKATKSAPKIPLSQERVSDSDSDSEETPSDENKQTSSGSRSESEQSGSNEASASSASAAGAETDGDEDSESEISDSSTEPSSSSEDESEDDTPPNVVNGSASIPGKAAPPKTIPPPNYQPPTGYSKLDLYGQTSVTGISSLQGKELWHITVPSSVSISSISTIPLDGLRSQTPILTRKNTSYALTETTPPSRNPSDLAETVVLPDVQSKMYKSTTLQITRSFKLQPHLDLPSLPKIQNTTLSGAQGATQTTRLPGIEIRPQPSGLRMRYKPPGFGPGNAGPIGSDESEPEAAEFRLPQTGKRKAHDEGEGKKKLSKEEKEAKKQRKAERSAKKARKEGKS